MNEKLGQFLEDLYIINFFYLMFFFVNFFFYLKNQFTIIFNYFLFFQAEIVIIVLIKIVCILIAVAYFTIAERKVMASIQRRMGPNVEGGPFGILQPLADGLKLFIKELIIPGRANIFIFLLAPILIFTLSIMGWSVIPFYTNYIFTNLLFIENSIFTSIKSFWVSDINYGILFLLAISSLNVYGIILGGWASNSKYAFLGALRSAAQMISYEVSIGLTLLPVLLLVGSLNLMDIILIQENTIWFIFPLFPCAIIFFISMLAETNRAPFDLPEAEAELVAGYNVEYGSMAFALFFLGEYSSMLLMASFLVILFFGGWLMPFIIFSNYCSFIYPLIFAIKITFFAFCYILVRAAFPRYRYDQLMDIGWKIFLPITLGFLILIACFLISFNFLIISSSF